MECRRRVKPPWKPPRQQGVRIRPALTRSTMGREASSHESPARGADASPQSRPAAGTRYAMFPRPHGKNIAGVAMSATIAAALTTCTANPARAGTTGFARTSRASPTPTTKSPRRVTGVRRASGVRTGGPLSAGSLPRQLRPDSERRNHHDRHGDDHTERAGRAPQRPIAATTIGKHTWRKNSTPIDQAGPLKPEAAKTSGCHAWTATT